MPFLFELPILPEKMGAATIEWIDPSEDDEFPLPTITTNGVITLPRLDGAGICPLSIRDQSLFIGGTDPEHPDDYTHHWLLGTHLFGDQQQVFCVRFAGDAAFKAFARGADGSERTRDLFMTILPEVIWEEFWKNGRPFQMLHEGLLACPLESWTPSIPNLEINDDRCEVGAIDVLTGSWVLGGGEMVTATVGSEREDGMIETAATEADLNSEERVEAIIANGTLSFDDFEVELEGPHLLIEMCHLHDTQPMLLSADSEDEADEDEETASLEGD